VTPPLREAMLAARPLLATVLLAAGAAKALGPPGHSALQRLAGRLPPGVLTGRRAVRVLGLAEVGVAALLLLPWTGRWGGAAASALLLPAVGFLLWARRTAPGQPCGCFGAAAADPVDARAVALGGTLLAMAVASSLVGGPWWRVGPTGWSVLAGLSALVLALSPALRHLLLHGTPTAGESAGTVPDAVAARVRASPAFAAFRDALLTADPVERWSRGSRSFLVHDGYLDDRVVAVVFVAFSGRRRDRVEVVVLDARTHQVLRDSGGVAALVTQG
jgi:hypothetical protein